jgi:hypothetical protein
MFGAALSPLPPLVKPGKLPALMFDNAQSRMYRGPILAAVNLPAQTIAQNVSVRADPGTVARAGDFRHQNNRRDK